MFPCCYWRWLFSESHVTKPMTADERFDERWIIICQKIGSFKNWLSDAIWNEVIQQFDESVQAEIVSHAVKCSFHGQADDGLTRVCIIEPFSHKTKTNHYFLVFYNLTAVNTNLKIQHIQWYFEKWLSADVYGCMNFCPSVIWPHFHSQCTKYSSLVSDLMLQTTTLYLPL